MITVGEAKRIAKEWVEAEAPNIPNFQGAFLSGSVIWKGDVEPQLATSDVDVKILVNIDDPKKLEELGFIQKYRSHKGILLETTYSPIQRFSSPESVLADFGYAAHFTRPNILSDPSGNLSKIQEAVSEQFTCKKWVMKRIEGIRNVALWGLNSLQSGSYLDRMLALWYATGISGLPPQADLRPPTIRKGGILYLQVMKKYGRQDLNESILKIYGCHTMTRMDVEMYLADLANTFNRAVEIVQSRSMGDYINPIARPIVMDGAWELMNGGFHREAMVWIGSMRTICQQTILQDAPEVELSHYIEQYKKLLAGLGLHSEADFLKRAEEGTILLDKMMQVAMEIVETNEKIVA